MTQPIGPFRLVTVNTAPERAKRLIGQVVEDVKEKYSIIHVANASGKRLRRCTLWDKPTDSSMQPLTT